MEANKLLIFPDLDAAGSRNRRTNHSFFFNLFADLTSAEVIQAQGWRTIVAPTHVLFARLISASLGRLQASEQLSRPRLFCSPGSPPRAAMHIRGLGQSMPPAAMYLPKSTARLATSSRCAIMALRYICYDQNGSKGEFHNISSFSLMKAGQPGSRRMTQRLKADFRIYSFPLVSS